MAELSRIPEDQVLETTGSSREGEESQAGRVWLQQHWHPTAPDQKETHHPQQRQRLGWGWGWGGEILLGKSRGTFSGSFLHIAECTEQLSGAVTPHCQCQCPPRQRDRLTAAQTAEAPRQHFSQWQVLLGKPGIKLSHRPRTISDSILSPQIPFLLDKYVAVWKNN